MIWETWWRKGATDLILLSASSCHNDLLYSGPRPELKFSAVWYLSSEFLSVLCRWEMVDGDGR